MAIDTGRIRETLAAHGVRLESADFHRLDLGTVESLVELARAPARGLRAIDSAVGLQAIDSAVGLQALDSAVHEKVRAC